MTHILEESSKNITITINLYLQTRENLLPSATGNLRLISTRLLDNSV